MKKVNMFFVAGMIGVLAACNSNTGSSGSTTQTSGDQKTAAAPAANNTVYKSDDLYTLYEKDYSMDKGNPKMDSSIVQIKDKITEISKYSTGGENGMQVSFGLQSDGSGSHKIEANFTGAEAAKVENLKAGDEISFQGKIVSGAFKTISLDNCTVK
jgi:hypothetical protein